MVTHYKTRQIRSRSPTMLSIHLVNSVSRAVNRAASSQYQQTKLARKPFATLLSLSLCLAPLSHRVPVYTSPGCPRAPLECSFAYVYFGEQRTVSKLLMKDAPSCSLQQQSYQSEFCHPSSRPCGVVVPLPAYRAIRGGSSR